MLVPVQVKRDNAGGFVGALLIFFGLIGCLFNFFAGLVVTGIGIVVASVGGKEAGLMCPNCGTQGLTLGEIASRVNPPPPPETSPPLDKVTVWSGIVLVAVVAVAAGIVIATYVISPNTVPEQTVGATAESTQTQSGPASHFVVTRISSDHYRAEDGTEILTRDCAEPAARVVVTFKYDFQGDQANNKITFPSGRSCSVIYAVR